MKRDSGKAENFGGKRISRRAFMKVISKTALGTYILSKVMRLPRTSYEPLAAPVDHRVVRAYHSSATNWDFATGYYWDYVDQSVVNEIVDRGVRELTSRSTAFAAWQDIMSSYQSGDNVAIKLNCNGCESHSIPRHVIDVTIEPIIAIVQGLVSIGIPQHRIYLYDASKWIHDRYPNRILSLYPDVNFVSIDQSTFGQTGDPDEAVTFSRPGFDPNCGEYPYPEIYIGDVLINAQHLINLCIMKSHGTGVTGAFKNHFGSVCCPGCFHLDFYWETQNPIVDLYLNPHIANKTRLIVGDALFGCWSHVVSDEGFVHPWVTFGSGAPNSLFFSVDPVALDSVMFDYLKAETDARGLYLEDAYFLHDAAARNLGIHEHRPYQRIAYREIGLSPTISGGVERRDVDRLIRNFKDGETTYEEVESTIEHYQLGTPQEDM